jgi:hypothetical protein
MGHMSLIENAGEENRMECSVTGRIGEGQDPRRSAHGGLRC